MRRLRVRGDGAWEIVVEACGVFVTDEPGWRTPLDRLAGLHEANDLLLKSCKTGVRITRSQVPAAIASSASRADLCIDLTCRRAG